MKNNTKKGNSTVKEFLTTAADWNKKRKAKDEVGIHFGNIPQLCIVGLNLEE